MFYWKNENHLSLNMLCDWKSVLNLFIEKLFTDNVVHCISRLFFVENVFEDFSWETILKSMLLEKCLKPFLWRKGLTEQIIFWSYVFGFLLFWKVMFTEKIVVGEMYSLKASSFKSRCCWKGDGVEHSSRLVQSNVENVEYGIKSWIWQ